jgi:hypothetical protein
LATAYFTNTQDIPYARQLFSDTNLLSKTYKTAGNKRLLQRLQIGSINEAHKFGDYVDRYHSLQYYVERGRVFISAPRNIISEKRRLKFRRKRTIAFQLYRKFTKLNTMDMLQYKRNFSLKKDHYLFIKSFCE